MYETLRVDTLDGVATITFTRPERRNSVTFELCLDFLAALDAVDADDDVRAVVVTGEGSHFCAGADLDQGFAHEAAEPSPVLRRYLEVAGTIGGVPRDGGGLLTLRLARMDKPVIAAINGSAVGVGATMTLPMDVRVAGHSTRMGFVFTRLGLVPEAASSWFLPRVVGISKAMEWVATARLIDAREALESRLVSYVVPDDEVVAKAQSIARLVAESTSPVAVAAARHLLWGMLTVPEPWRAHELESRAIYHLAAGDDVQEGVTAFLEKRSAVFPLSVSTDYPEYLPRWAERPEHLGS